MTTLVAQITRGMAPAQSIVEAVTYAHSFSAQYRLIAGRPCVEAKNAAADAALHRRMDLLLVEDDFIASAAQWRTAVKCRDAIYYGDGMCRNGERSTHLDATGGLLFTGTVMVKVPLEILRRLAEDAPIFRSYEFTEINGELHPVGPFPLGMHSDVYFWWRVRQLVPRPECRPLGRLTTIVHPYNSGSEYVLHEPTRLEFRA